MTEETATNNTKTNQYEQLRKMSIQAGLNGLSFCVYDSITNRIELSDRIVFENQQSPLALLEAMQGLFRKQGIQDQDFSKVSLVHNNDLFTLVPKPFFSAENLSHYLKYNNKLLAYDQPSYDEVPNLDLACVFVPFTNLNNYLFELFGEFDYTHIANAMLQNTFAQNDKENGCFVYVEEGKMYCTLIKNNKFLLYNQYPFQCKEDFLYYLLFVYEQMDLDNNRFPLTLFGQVKEGDPIFNICHQYINLVTVTEPKTIVYEGLGDEGNSIDLTWLTVTS